MRRSLRIFPVLFAVIFIGLFMGCMSNDTRFEEMIDEVSLSEEYLSLLEDSAVYPGFSYIAVRSDRVLLQYSGGFASIGSEETVGANTSFPVFSISKLITALAILQLTERGEISLDDHVSNHIPGYPHALTIRSLLNHASGLPDPLWGSFYIHFTEEHAEVDRSALLQELGEKHPRRPMIRGKKADTPTSDLRSSGS
jgi:CubicO group peptidase (beta-lactamase class C family)